MGYQIDLDSPVFPTRTNRCRPGPVQKLNGVAGHRGHLILQWSPPRGGGLVSGYRIERTKDGKTYETIGETAIGWFSVPAVPGEIWFYQVAACNARGVTRSTWIVCYRATDRFVRGGHNEETLLMHIPVMPGVCFTVCDFGPSHRLPAFAKPSPEAIRRRALSVRQYFADRQAAAAAQAGSVARPAAMT